MKVEKEMTCIVCPNGCKLEVTYENTITVKNALCPKGVEYARNELMNPVRNLTSTVKVLDGVLPIVSVRSNKPVPKGRLAEIVRILRGVEVKAPVEFHQVVFSDILGTGAYIITTREVLEKDFKRSI
jgi:CxxC motif-containing protein